MAFQTKPEIALALLDEARALGVAHACLTADADYGDNPVFLNGLEARGERHVVAVRADFTVAQTRRGAHAGPTERTDEVLAAVPRGVWQTVAWGEGARGTLRAKAVAVRCWRVDGDGTPHVGWLLGQRPARGQDPKGDGSTSGATSARRWGSRGSWSTRIGATGSSSTTRRRRGNSGGTTSRAAATTRSTAMR